MNAFQLMIHMDLWLMQNIHYKGRIIRYLDTPCRIDNLPMVEVLLGDLENISWIVCLYYYVITPNNKEQHYFLSFE